MIPITEPFFGKEELDNVTKAVETGWISSKGDFIIQFEKDFAEYCGRKYAVAVSTGTAALHLALVALGIGKGDEVIIPNMTFIANSNVVKYCNAKPVLVDMHPDYWGIDPKEIEKAITPKTKAITIVHLYGHPCDIDPILKIAKKHNLYVIEDAAQAHGTEYKGKKIGGFGDVSCFSFFGNKIMTTGEGGMCLTDNKELADKIRRLGTEYGMDPQKKYWHDIVAFNYRLTNMQAAVGIGQLRKLDSFVKKRKQIADLYSEGLKDLVTDGKIKLQKEMEWAKMVHWFYLILIEDSKISRDKLMDELKKRDIDSRPFFYPLNIMPPDKTKKSFPVSESIYTKGVCLPMSVNLTNEQIKTITNAIKEIFSSSALEFSPAEIIDNMSITKLKIERIGEPGLKKEFKEYGNTVDEFKKQGIKIKLQWFNQLYKINGKIWDQEFVVRQIANKIMNQSEEKELSDKEYEELGKRYLIVGKLMKQRVDIKNKIAKQTGKGFKETKSDHCAE